MAKSIKPYARLGALAVFVTVLILAAAFFVKFHVKTRSNVDKSIVGEAPPAYSGSVDAPSRIGKPSNFPSLTTSVPASSPEFLPTISKVTVPAFDSEIERNVSSTYEETLTALASSTASPITPENTVAPHTSESVSAPTDPALEGTGLQNAAAAPAHSTSMTSPTASPIRPESRVNASSTIAFGESSEISPPSPLPVASVSPTAAPHSFDFQLRMYWQEGYTWQGVRTETRFCAECIECKALTTDDLGEGCDRAKCAADGQLWIHECDLGYGDEFKAVALPGGFNQIQIAATDLCLERTQKRYITLQICDEDVINQHWDAIFREGKFEITPRDKSRDDEAACVTSHHEPKAWEVLFLGSCELARFWKTSYWIAYDQGSN